MSEQRFTTECYEVFISNGGGECPRFEVVAHIFGKIPEGDAHNQIVIEQRQFIEDAIKEKLARERGRDDPS